ncbi:imidazolonepropionase-like amidohydrolase [Cecembia calidifontis]|jgi:imidazolonepropionase-like amidohydrolase|uniref:Imidazolonepropionase-like amidohydrolase n=2 Tax=Cecembia calidifontis TaxID=1187080 RepID=A0A4Q7PE70_9BACT|nr:amidohydrolase family protein [Cecembia calidifontis]RZS98078.1 imidazolonepropionase-like amidohydrolase [Cecembia calidifontis]
MKNMKKLLYSFAISMLPFLVQAQFDGEFVKPRTGKFLLQNATVVTVTKGTLEKTSVLIDNGKILAVGQNIQEADAEIIDCSGHYIYPGMVDAGSRLGLVEVNSLPETQDYAEIGQVTPNMQALVAVNPNSVAIPVTRVSGVTTTLAVPSGGLFPGTAALINLNGYTPDQMFAGFKGVVLNFPSSARRSTWDRRSDEDIKKEAEAAQKTLNDIWSRAETYYQLQKAKAELQYYPEMEQLAKVIAGELPLLVEVNAASDILSAIDWIKSKKVKAILMGVAEGWRVADKIAAAGIPVIVGPMLSIPTRQSDRYDAAYTNPGKMAKAGVKVVIRSNDAENTRNLPFNAGFAAAYGMGKEEALKAITINAAEVFGIADRMGSIEVGKDATLFVSTGDPFETKSQILHVFIDGYRVPMSSRHIKLYQEFLERSPGLEKN